MKINQIHSELNTILAMMKYDDISSVDPSVLVSVGDDILNAQNGVQNFGKALGDRIARIITEVQPYVRRDRGLYTEPITYGSALKIIHFKDNSNTANTMWGSTPNTNPYAVGSLLDYTQSIYSKMGVWSYGALIVQRDQIKKAFANAEELGAFLENQFTIVYNNFEMDIEATDNLAIISGIRDCYEYRSTLPMRAINLLSEYNATLPSGATALTVATALASKEFLRFASQRIKNVYNYATKTKTEIFNNVDGISMKLENPKLEIISNFASASQYYLESDVFHNTLVSLPSYSEVSYWQAIGESFDDNMKIEMVATDEEEDDISISCVVGFLRDEKAIRTTFNDVYADSIYNPADRTTRYFFNAERGYMVDKAYPMILFYMA